MALGQITHYTSAMAGMWDLTWGVSAGFYVVGSLINGLMDPTIGVALVAIGGFKLMHSLWKRYRSLGA